jgi:hypothetical protein
MIAAACTSPAAPPKDIYGSIRKCGLEGLIRIDAEGERRFRISYIDPNADYEMVDCFLAEAKRLRLDLGFVGNEAVSTN